MYKAEKANAFLNALVSTFDMEVGHVDYYIASSCSEIFKLKGFEDVVGMYCSECNNLCGFTDRINNIIYSNSIEGELYAHELMRLLIKFYPKAENVFINGLAAYVGGDYKVGLPIKEHFRRMDEYLKEHTEINLSDIYSWNYMDETTNPSYYIGALICHLCLKKGGLPLLKKGLKVDGTNNLAIYEFFEEELKIPKAKLNQEIRKEIHKMALTGFETILFSDIEKASL